MTGTLNGGHVTPSSQSMRGSMREIREGELWLPSVEAQHLALTGHYGRRKGNRWSADDTGEDSVIGEFEYSPTTKYGNVTGWQGRWWCHDKPPPQARRVLYELLTGLGVPWLVHNDAVLLIDVCIMCYHSANWSQVHYSNHTCTHCPGLACVIVQRPTVFGRFYQ